METRLNNHAKNRILADLTSAEYQRIFPHLETVDLSSGKIIYDLGQPIDYLYFPLGSMISLVTQMEDGKIVEVGLVGNDGMSGISALLGQKTVAGSGVCSDPQRGGKDQAGSNPTEQADCLRFKSEQYCSCSSSAFTITFD